MRLKLPSCQLTQNLGKVVEDRGEAEAHGYTRLYTLIWWEPMSHLTISATALM